MGRLAGKVAVITGATTGIGAGSAEVFAREGAKVVLAGRNAERGEAVAAKIGADALFVQTDVSDEAQVKALVDRAVDHFGRIDCLFSNAGSAGPGGPLADLDFDKVRGAMDVLIGGVLAGIKHAAPIMRDQGGGSIIATASIAGHQVGYGPSIYSMCKAAVIHLCRVAAMEYGRHGVRVNSISPGAIMTPMLGMSNGLSLEEAEARMDRIEAVMLKRQVVPKVGQPEDIAEAAVYLASDASSFVNGHDMIIDGGLIQGRRAEDMASARGEMQEAMFGD